LGGTTQRSDLEKNQPFPSLHCQKMERLGEGAMVRRGMGKKNEGGHPRAEKTKVKRAFWGHKARLGIGETDA